MVFDPKNNANPQGMLPVGSNIKEARKLTRLEFEAIAHKYLFMTIGQLKKVSGSDDLPSIDQMIIGAMLEGMKGNWKAFSFILDRTIGMAVRRHTVVIDDERDNSNKIPLALNDQERLAMLEIYKKKIMEKIKQDDAIDVSPAGD